MTVKLLNFIFGCVFLVFCTSGQENKLKNDSVVIKNYDTSFMSGQTDSLVLYMVQKIPSDLCQQTQLKRLSIYGFDCDLPGHCTGIGELPLCICNMTNLEYLIYGVTGMTYIPEEIKHLKNLKVLCLSDNSSLVDIGNIKCLENLEVLAFFGCNSLKNIVDDISHLKKLRELNLEGCNSITANEISALKKVIPKDCKITYDE